MPPSAMSSSCVPCSRSLPLCMQQMVSADRMVERRCATQTVVRSCSRRSIAACTTCSDSASRADVASSSSRTFGSINRARAMAIRCFWPPLSCTPRSPTVVS
mmetsp:Transcript_69515/g.154987  ORF Transcript_69515/g.154987 Transcript_69515/m.154987 type:complete len:102 (-) Transcript_69515:18-323(-)